VAQHALVDFVNRYHDQPVLLVQEVLGSEPDDKQSALLNAVARGDRRVAVRSGHGVGKTTVLAWLIIWWMLTRFPQKTAATAATSSQLNDALVKETKAWIGKLPPPIRDLFEIKSDTIELRAAPNESFVSFKTSRPETPEALAGVHSDNTLLIGDEASGIHEAVYEAAAGSMSGHNAHTVLAGNPVRRSGLFYDAFHKLRDMWTCIHISCVGHPRVTADFVEDMKRRYGEGTNAFRVRVLGEFPEAEDDVIIPYEWVEAALLRDVQPFAVKPIWGVDVARSGRDSNALARRKGNVLERPVEVWRNDDLMQTVGRIKLAWDTCIPSRRPSEINVDSIGLGAGVADRLLEMGLPARAINVAESAAMSDRFVNLRTELWFRGRDFFEKKDSNLAGDAELLAELILPTYTITSAGKQKAESKDELKARGYDSPNRADAFLLTLASEAISASGQAAQSNWRQPLKRLIRGLV